MTILQQRLFLLDSRQRERSKNRESPENKNLKVYYGWCKINKIRKKEAISVIFENESYRNDKKERAIRKYQDTVFVRYQTQEETKDSEFSNRIFTEFCIFMDDKKIKGSLSEALRANSEADKKHVAASVRDEIAKALRSHFIMNHPLYNEPSRKGEQLLIEF